MNKQYFYLVCKQVGNAIFPIKIFLQEYEASKYSKALAIKEKHSNISYALYRQEITRNGELEYIAILKPFVI